MRDLFKVPNSWDVPSGLVVKTLHYGHGFMGSGNQDPTGHALKKKKWPNLFLKTCCHAFCLPRVLDMGGRQLSGPPCRGKVP